MLDTIFPFLRSRPSLIVIQRAHQNSNSPEFSVYKIPRFPDEFLVAGLSFPQCFRNWHLRGAYCGKQAAEEAHQHRKDQSNQNDRRSDLEGKRQLAEALGLSGA